MTTSTVNILHVEDDTDIQNYVAALLCDFASITTAPGLQEARTCFANRDYDLVIIDFTLPDGSGTTLVSDIAAENPSLPIIVLSAHDISSNMVNVDHVYLKGRFRDDDFIERVRELCKL